MNKLLIFIPIIFFFSCNFEPQQNYGCTISAACNFDSDANVFDDSCIYYSDCFGECGGNAEILTYWFDEDNDSLGTGESQQFCDASVDEGWVLNNDDEYDFCFSNIVDCVGICDGDAFIEDSICYIHDIDGNLYSTIQIGSQVWMGENLKVTHYSSGDSIQYVQSESTEPDIWENLITGAYGYYNQELSNHQIYGNLYNWYTVGDNRGVCPENWHVPTDEEFISLEIFLGMTETEAYFTDFRGTNEGSMLSGNADLWYDGELKNNNDFGTNGFNVLPAGHRYANPGSYNLLGSYAYFWSSTELSSSNAWNRLFGYDNSEVYRGIINKHYGLSIRCLRD